MQLGDRVREIVEAAGDAWVLKKRAEDLVWLQVFEGISDDDPPTKWLRARARYGDRLRQAIFIDKVSCRLRLRDAMGERHRLCRRRRLVEQRSVGDIEPGQVRDDRLKIEQRLKSPLADLRLIGRVSRVPCRILQNVALDRRRHDRSVIALADERRQDAVLVRGLAQAIERAALGERPVEVERLAETNVLGNGLVDQHVETRNAHDPQHFGDFLGRRPDVATIREVVGFVCVGAHLVPIGHHIISH